MKNKTKFVVQKAVPEIIRNYHKIKKQEKRYAKAKKDKSR